MFRRHARVAAVLGCAALALGVAQGPSAAAAQEAGGARGALPAGDGWASADGGTTGGAKADKAHTFTVTNRAELVKALGDGDATPRLIRVKGTIDANTDDAGKPLSCADYATDGYSLDAYLTAYDPATWGKAAPSGPQEDARAASAARQYERVELKVGSNTTILGVGRNARLLGASLQIRGVDNVIVRNVTFEDAFDCFPAWDPTDGDDGNWNSEYDNLVVYGSTHVWVDHNTFTDGRRPDSAQPSYFGRLYQQHDGELDVVRGADLVTASWNVFADHDKTLMIGNSDSAGATDRGKLRVTLHHNLFKNIVERAPRVRFGKVDAYNNHFVAPRSGYAYSWGIGVESQLYAEANAFTVPASVDPATIIKKWKGTALTAKNNHLGGKAADLLALHNAGVPDEQLGGDAGWTPTLRTRVDAPRAVPGIVGKDAGAGRF
ncbi:polysaccharide lyase family 1 protein [Streptomyces sp. Rer75]|uniref:pectate lyase family protein n=1 Tax=Streptomyces sp. Rer75 TaxID=2750011 RepID=UPI0015D0B775|nr:pectate lyase [Streptomyces sp. Rer75]QLH21000.1 pectate lyase [Streptomyces sp. Rer75]